MSYASRAAAAIKERFSLETELIEGGRGEFTVWIGDKKIAEKGWIRFPTIDKILTAVESELH
ncbi:MAG: Rdx family protein [Pyrinomonadaceae bacterium]|nr:Rdx family protein [Pyrinomonadaceae bacterium]